MLISDTQIFADIFTAFSPLRMLFLLFGNIDETPLLEYPVRMVLNNILNIRGRSKLSSDLETARNCVGPFLSSVVQVRIRDISVSQVGTLWQ